jgi:hypothetical protein
MTRNSGSLDKSSSCSFLIDFFGVRAGILGKISAKISPWTKFSTEPLFSLLGVDESEPNIAITLLSLRFPQFHKSYQQLLTLYAQVYQQPM